MYQILLMIRLLEAVVMLLNSTNWINTDPDFYHRISAPLTDAIYKLKQRWED